MGFRNCSMFCCALLYVRSSLAIILMEKRELVALLSWSSWCLVIVLRLFLTVPWVCLQFVIVVFPDHTRLLFFIGHLVARKPDFVACEQQRRISVFASAQIDQRLCYSLSRKGNCQLSKSIVHGYSCHVNINNLPYGDS